MLTWRMAIPLDAASVAPIFLQIAQGIERAIREGRLKPGEALPGTRALADQLDVNRNTVVAAYQELTAEGWLQARAGGGTFVAEVLPAPLRQARPSLPGTPALRINPAPGGGSVLPPPATVLSCLTGEVDPRMLPMDALARAYQRAARTHDPRPFTHESPQGSERFRTALAGMLAQTKGLSASRDTLLLLPGLREGLNLACRALLRPGQAVAVEALGSRAHWDALRGAGADLVGVPVDAEGLDVGGLEKLLERVPVGMVLVTALRQYPTTASLAPVRRRRLLELSAARGIPIVEIDLDPGFQFEGSPALPLAAEDAHGTVIYLGAFSKLLFPNLPVAFLHAGGGLVPDLVGWRQTLAQGGDPFLERALTELMEDGEIQRHLHRLRRATLERRDALAEALAQRLGGVLEVRKPAGGLAFWLQIRDAGLDVQAWAHRALREGVAFRPGGDFTFDGRPLAWMRLGFGLLSAGELREAASRLERALA